MLFKIQGFKSPLVGYPKNLYKLNVLEGLGEQKLPLKDDLLDKFDFYQAVCEAGGVQIVTDQ
jgi:hypothetical protein